METHPLPQLVGLDDVTRLELDVVALGSVI